MLLWELDYDEHCVDPKAVELRVSQMDSIFPAGCKEYQCRENGNGEWVAVEGDLEREVI